jgi:outer membrane protein TolC
MTTQLGIWSYGAQVSQPIFTGGALKGNLHLAESQHQQTLIGYREAIQHAFGEVSDALIGYEKFHQVRTRQQDSVRICRKPFAFPRFATRAARRHTSKYSTDSGRFTAPN